MPDPVFIGQLVQTPRDPIANGGVDKAPAVVTEIEGEGPNGGVLVNVKVFANAADSGLEYVTGLEFVDYEETARNLGVGAGAWPLDYTWA